MKTVLEFGVRGGTCIEATVFPTYKLAALMALNLVRVFKNDPSFKADFTVSKKQPRISWQSSTHFVSVSLLDGVMRGPASAKLWKKDN
jgi:hypothetical protein